MERPISAVMYHGTIASVRQLDPRRTHDGGIHLGCLEQARMRAPVRDAHVLVVQVHLEHVRRSRDTPASWIPRIRSARGDGCDGIVYLNRYEGLTTATVTRASAMGVDLDALSDEEFRSFAPEARDSVIVFHADSLQVIGAEPISPRARRRPLELEMA